MVVSPLDNPYVIWTGIMDELQYAQNGPNDFTIKLTAVNENFDRRRPVHSMLTYADQIARFPGDASLRYRVQMRAKTLSDPC